MRRLLSPLRPLVRRPWTWAVAALLPLLLAACGGSGPNAAGPAALTDVVATSGTSVRVSFSAPVGEGADDPVRYRLLHDGGTLSVLAAHPSDDATTVHLATAPQASDRTYRLALDGVRSRNGAEVSFNEGDADASFTGSTVAAPILASAVPLSNTRVLLTFVDPDGLRPVTLKATAENPAYYVFDPDLPVESVEMAYPNFVILTTAPQEDRDYEITVTNVEDSAGRLIDPSRASDTFAAIPADDAQPPAVTSAVALTDRTVQVSFSEPVRDTAADAANYEIVDSSGQPLAVRQATLNHPYNTVATLTTVPQTVGASYVVRVRNVLDQQGNAMRPAGATATFTGLGAVTEGRPRVVGAGATDNTTVLVTFDKPMDPASTEVAAHYGIGEQGGGGSLTVESASLTTPTTVELTTRAQSRVRYVVEVVNVTDAQGNQLEAPSFLNPNPNRAVFTGIAPSDGDADGEGDLTDTDGDGLSDAEEQRGWTVTVTVVNGDPLEYQVTSDPTLADTDDDGIADGDEKAYRTDPRDADTDDDNLTDNEELNVVYSEPALQDTDGDTLIDGLEFTFFGTSPLLTDTDGDQFPDDDEVSLQSRDPRIADLPDFDMSVVGDVQLGLDVRFTATDETGSRELESRTSETALVTQSSSSQESGSASASEWFVNGSFNLDVGWDDGFYWGAGIGVTGGYSESSSTSFTQASARSAQQEQQNSLTTDVETEEGETVTREVLGASMAVALEIENQSDIAFTLENVELVAKVVDPRDPTSFVPVATLTGQAERYTLGPAPDARGPFRFVADSPAPALIERLRENPRNLVFEVANYDVVDEFERNFSYTYQDVADRTATLQIDYGGRLPEEVERVTTQSGFDETGRALGVTMQDVMEVILGLEYKELGDTDAENPDLREEALRTCLEAEDCSPEQYATIKGSYSTDVDEGETVLYRVRNIMNDSDDGLEWIVSADLPDGVVPPTDFNEIRAVAGRYFRLFYGQDLDGDGLTLQQEAIYGSLDAPTDELNNDCFGRPTYEPPAGEPCDQGNGTPDSRDTDRDGISDDEEIFGRLIGGQYEPWIVAPRGSDAYPTSSSPARYDTDGDGLTDCQELGRCGVYVYLYPSDDTSVPASDQTAPSGDAVQDGTVLGTYVDPSGRPSVAPGLDPAWAVKVDSGDRIDPSMFDSDADGLADRTEIVGPRYRPLNAQLGDDDVQVLPTDADDFELKKACDAVADLPVDASTDLATVLSDVTSLPACHGTDPLNGDSDFDVLTDGVEVQIGSDPTDGGSTRDGALDDDGDGLRNIEEDVGWIVAYRDDTGTWVDHAGNALKVDASDPSKLEDANGNPVPLDAFGNPVLYDDVVLASDGTTAPQRVDSERTRADTDLDGLSDLQERQLHTNPRKRDTDDDGLTDAQEIAGTDFPIGGVDDVRFPNFLAWDTDGDGLSDGEEANEPWTIALPGEDPYLAYADPTRADADLDGLTDSEEKRPVSPHTSADASDPNRADTDGDGVSDKAEIDWTSGGGGSAVRSPTTPDQVIEFHYANATMLETCYLVAGEDSFDEWRLFADADFAAFGYSEFGGNDGGYLWIQTYSAFWLSFSGDAKIRLDAPSKFYGDMSDYASFDFDLRQYQREGQQSRFDPRIFIRGDGKTLTYDYDPPTGDDEFHETTSWETLSIPLTAAADPDNADTDNNWSEGDAPVDGTTLGNVLASVDRVWIEGQYQAPDTFLGIFGGGMGLDNVRFAGGDGNGPVSDFNSGELGSGNFSGSFNLEYPAGGGGLATEELVRAGTVLSQTRAGDTVSLDHEGGVAEPFTFVVGEEQGFRVFSSSIIEQSEEYALGLDNRAYANYGSLSTTYDYPVVGGIENEILRGQSHDNERDCQLDVSWTWRVVQ